MKAYLIGLLVCLAVAHCKSTLSNGPTNAVMATDALVIRSGTSFGFCTGYCNQQMDVSAGKAVFTKTSRTPAQYPDKTCTATLTEADWATLKAQADLTLLRKQPTTLGCPDCADGGAEFLEIEQGTERYRVTFEAGKSVPGFEGLITALRAKRKTFDTCQ